MGQGFFTFSKFKTISHPDTAIVQKLNSESKELWKTGDYILAKEKSFEALKISTKINYPEGIAGAHQNLGVISWMLGEIENAFSYYDSAIVIRTTLNDEAGLAGLYNNKGLLYYDQGNYSSALDIFYTSLKITEKLQNENLLTNLYNNIGLVYMEQKNYNAALKNIKKSLDIEEKIGGDKRGIAIGYNNIGLIYYYKENYTKALDNYYISLALRESVDDKSGIANSYNNIALIYKMQGDLISSRDFNTKAMEIQLAIGDKNGYLLSCNNIGQIYTLLNDTEKAAHYLNLAKKAAHEINSLLQIGNNYLYFSDLYESNLQYKEALDNFKNYFKYHDSLLREESSKTVYQKQLQYDLENKIVKDSLNTELNLQKIENQKNQINAKQNQLLLLIISAVGLIILVTVIYGRFKTTKNKNNIITEQKRIVEDKNKEITDSINYAKRIQKAILPPTRILEENLPEHFVLYKPKDIVAGDFYWLEKLGSDLFFAVADCTGHGVPGAMVSVICNNGLNRSVREHNITDTGAILNKTREIIIQEFEKSDDEVKDGMDICLIKLPVRSSAQKGSDEFTISFSGANNPLWISKNDHEEIIELKGDSQPIGKHIQSHPFTVQSIQVISGDILYLITDGFPDQFGGPKGKKFMYKKLKELLHSTRHMSMENQKEQLQKVFDLWKGDLEQIDDVCIVGIRI